MTDNQRKSNSKAKKKNETPIPETQYCSENGNFDKMTDDKGFLMKTILAEKDNVIAVKDTLIQELYRNISLQNEKIHFLEEKIKILTKPENQQRISYSEAVRSNQQIETKSNVDASTVSNKERILNSPYIFIKPKTNQDAIETKKDVLERVKPVDLNIGIQRVFNLKEGAIKIQCNSKEDLEKLKKKASEKLGTNYEVTSSKKKNPCIKIIGLDRNYSEIELKECIKEQNNFVKEDSHIKIIVVKKMKQKYLAIIELDATAFRDVMDSGAVMVDLCVCPAFEYVGIRRCFNCCGFNHSNKHCKNAARCITCGLDGHLASNCVTNKELYCCPNCNESNCKYNTSFFINHGPFDQNCEVIKRKIQHEKKNVNYE